MSVRILKVTSHVSTPSQLEERFKLWKECIAQAMKEKCKEEISMQTYLGSDVRNGAKSSSLLDSRTQAYLWTGGGGRGGGWELWLRLSQCWDSRSSIHHLYKIKSGPLIRTLP